MAIVRTYGNAPFNVAVVHGGPGAAGGMATVARELSLERGVLEPLQTEHSVDGQVDELKCALEDYGSPPIILIGHSWGAWLSYVLAARYPMLVKKLILVGSGVFEDHYVQNLMPTRLNRLNDDDRREVQELLEALNNPTINKKNDIFCRFGELMSKADTYAPVASDESPIDCQYGIYQSVWPEANALRASGKLLAMGRDIQCPVVAFHGDHDPSPAEGVREPLCRIVKDFRFILLDKCGHEPWREIYVSQYFFDVLRYELEH